MSRLFKIGATAAMGAPDGVKILNNYAQTESRTLMRLSFTPIIPTTLSRFHATMLLWGKAI